MTQNQYRSNRQNTSKAKAIAATNKSREYALHALLITIALLGGFLVHANTI